MKEGAGGVKVQFSSSTEMFALLSLVLDNVVEVPGVVVVVVVFVGRALAVVEESTVVGMRAQLQAPLHWQVVSLGFLLH